LFIDLPLDDSLFLNFLSNPVIDLRQRQRRAGSMARHGLLSKHDRLLRLEKEVGKRKVKLTGEQIRLMERFSPEFRERHIETSHTGDLVAVDTFYVGALKGGPNLSAVSP